jgi:hypothetical protein
MDHFTVPCAISKGRKPLHQRENRVDHAMIETFLTPLTMIPKSLSLQAQLHPPFDAKAWLPFMMVQGTTMVY